MEIIDPERDMRRPTAEQWSRMRWLQDRAMKDEINPRLFLQEYGESLELLFRECRRLRSLAQYQYLTGYNEGYDTGLAVGSFDRKFDEYVAEHLELDTNPVV